MTQTQVQYLANLEQARHNRKTEELQERLLGSQQAANVGSFLRGAYSYVAPTPPGGKGGKTTPSGSGKSGKATAANAKGKKPSSGAGKEALKGGAATAVGSAIKAAGPYAGAAAAALGAAALKSEIAMEGLESFIEETGVTPQQLVDAGVVSRNQVYNLAHNTTVPRSNRQAIYAGWVDRYKQKKMQENITRGGLS